MSSPAGTEHARKITGDKKRRDRGLWSQHGASRQGQRGAARRRHRRRRHGEQPCARPGRASGIQLVGVADPDRNQRDSRQARARLPRRSTMSRRCCTLGVDAVTIAAPTHLHHDIALACIARGIHVLVEKPIASIRRGGPQHHRGRAPGRRHADGRPRRALQSGRRRRSRRRSAARIFSRSPSRGSVRSRRACRMSAWSSTSPCTTST